MQDLQDFALYSRTVPEEAAVIDFASWVVGQVAARKSVSQHRLRHSIVDDLIAASTSAQADDLPVFLRSVVRQKITPVLLADFYVPAAAQRLGDGWMEDRYSFAEVSVGTSRLQMLLRTISDAWMADTAEASGGSTVMLTSVPAEQHTLGAMVLLGQLRRSGVSVGLALGATDADLKAKFTDCNYSAVLVTSSSRDGLAELSEFVAQIRRLGPRNIPVVIGGGVFQIRDEVLAATGANDVVNSVEGALRFCRALHEEPNAQMRA